MIACPRGGTLLGDEMKTRLIIAATAALLTACGGSTTHETGGDASAATIKANAAVAASLPLADQQDFEDARQRMNLWKIKQERNFHRIAFLYKTPKYHQM